MADFLVQRYLHNLINTIRDESGVWEDCFLIKGVTAGEAKEATEQAMGGQEAAVAGVPDRLRAIRWDMLSEFDAPMGPRVLSPRTAEGPPVLGGTAGTA